MLIRILFISLCFFCCNNSANRIASIPSSKHSAIISQSQNSTANTLAPFDFSVPSEIFVLDKRLREISSFAFDSVANSILTNNDESGYFYRLDCADFTIKEAVKFAKKGDYEAIEIVGKNIYIAKSNGNIYSYNSTTQKTESIKSQLSSANNVEGLCYDASIESLLLACKGQPLGSNAKTNDTKCIYKLNLENNRLDTLPFISVRKKDLIKFIEQKYSGHSESSLRKFRQRSKEFALSGIAIHPQSDAYYLISAKGSSLVIYDRERELADVVFLNKKTIPQPEGITFDYNNNLFIATEGQGFSGKVFKFQPQ